MRLEHHLVGGYVRYISPHIIIIINNFCGSKTITVDLINPFVFFRRLAQITPVDSIF